MAAEQLEDGQVGTGLLGEADVIEGGQVAQAPQHHGRIVDVQRRAEPPGQIGDGERGDFGSQGSGHGVSIKQENQQPARCPK